MAGRGVHFGVDADVVATLRAAAGDDDALEEAVEVVEEAWDEERVFETDKAWYALHCAMPEGPLQLVFFGGEVLNQGEDYWVVVLSPQQVAEVAAALAAVDQATLRGWYDAIDPAQHPRRGDEDFDYTWANFEGLPDYFSRMAAGGHHVIFTVDT